MNITGYLDLCNKNYIKTYGKVVKVVGLTVESTGPEAKVGDTCRIAPFYSDTARNRLCGICAVSLWV